MFDMSSHLLSITFNVDLVVITLVFVLRHLVKKYAYKSACVRTSLCSA